MIRKERNIKFVYSVFIAMIIIVFAFCTSFCVFHLYQGIRYNIPNEYRDFSLLRIVQIFLDGHNPYTLDFQNQLNSPELFQYTLLVPLMATIFTPLFGGNILITYFVLNVFYILLTAILLCAILKRWIPQIKWYWYLVVYVHVLGMFTIFLGNRPAFTFRPDGIGVAVLAIVYYMMFVKKQHVFLISLFSVLLFFTKQFFIIVAIPITIYYFLLNKKMAIKYIIYCMVLGIISIVLMQLIFPLYWTHTIYSQMFSDIDFGSLFFSLRNLGLFCLRVESVAVILVAIFAISILIKCLRLPKKKEISTKIKDNLYVVFLFSMIIIYILFLLRLAQTRGDGFKYVNSMLSAPILLLAIYYVNVKLPNLLKKEWHSYKLVITVAFAVLLIVSPLKAFNWDSYSFEEIEEWKKLTTICNQYKSDTMFLSPLVSSYFLERDNGIYEGYYDDGHMEYFRFFKHSDIDTLFVGVEEERKIVQDFQTKIADKIEKGEFELVIVPDTYWMFDTGILETHYTNSQKLNLQASANAANVNVWIRTKE